MKLLITLLVMLLPTVAARAYTVSGAVADSLGQPEPYATVRVYPAEGDTLKAAALGVTSEQGAFSLALPGAGAYRLAVSSVGRAPLQLPFTVTAASPHASLGTLTLADAGATLGEVTVTAQAPLVTREIDRLGYDVQADPDAPTSSVADILRKVPLVTVDGEGNIKVRGSSNFKVYKNGRPSASYTRNAKELFKAIPASSIRKIEVITDPGAREDAEGTGAILNIITTDNSQLAGVTGTASLSYDTGHDWPSPSLYVLTQTGKVSLSAYGGANSLSRRSDINQATSTTISYTASGRTLSDQMRARGSGTVTYWGLEGSWEPDSLNLVTLEWGGYNYAYALQGAGTSAMHSPDGSLLYSYVTRMGRYRQHYLDFDGALNYQHSTHRPGETLTLSYRVSTTSQDNTSPFTFHDICGDPPFAYTGTVNDNSLRFLEQTAQADWQRPLRAGHTLNVGLKYINRRNTSSNMMELTGVSTSYTRFRHITDVAAAYVDYRLKLGRWGGRAGVRYEYSHLQARWLSGEGTPFSRNLNDVVPAAAVSYDASDVSSWKLAFSSRISRPGIQYLNPTVVTGPNSVSYGNARLESAMYYNPTLTYTFTGQHFTADATLAATWANNQIAERMWADGNVLYTTYANGGRYRNASLSLYMSWTPWPNTQLMANTTVAYDYYRVPSPRRSNHGWEFDFWAMASQRLPWGLRLQGQVWLDTGSVSDAFTSTGAATPWHRISLRRSWLRDDRLTVELFATCPFAPRQHFSQSTLTADYSRHTDTTSLGRRTFGLKLSYRFGSLQASVKKTAVAIENTDLQGRKQ